MLTGLEGDPCRRMSGCCRNGTDLRVGNSCEMTGGVCSTRLIDRRVGESLGAWSWLFSAAMPVGYEDRWSCLRVGCQAVRSMMV
jgi:hypothetical protein